MKKQKRHYVVLTAAQVREFIELRERQYIAWETRNRSQAAEIGKQLAELRHSNMAYREL